MISDEDRRERLTPTVVFRGALRSWKPRGDLAVDLEYTDAVGLKLARRGTDRQIPTRLVTVADFPTAPASAQTQPIPIIYGGHGWWTGACPVVYVGTLNLGAGAIHTWAVACHAVKAVTDIHLDDVRISAGWGTSWYSPWETGWPLATTYKDINGRRYTLIQGTGADADAVAAGSKKLTVNVQGVETVGDGTGALITQSFLQYLHFFRHFVLGTSDVIFSVDYQGGNWPTDPVEWEPGWCQIHAQSFVDAQAESARYIGGVGYEGQAYIGPTRRSVRDWLATWNTSLNCRLGLNRYHQWYCSVLPAALAAEDRAALPRLSDVEDVHQNSLSMQALDDEAVTRVTAYAFVLPKETSIYGGTETYADRVAEEDLGGEIGASLHMDFLASTPQTSGPKTTLLTASAEDVAKRWLGFRSGAPVYRVSFRTGLCAYETVDVGQLFRLTHFAGTTADGWTDRILWCEKVALDIDGREVEITALDVTHVYDGARTLEEIVTGGGTQSESGMTAPTGFAFSLITRTLGSSYYGDPGVTAYYKLVAVFDSGEESKPAIVGPVTTSTDDWAQRCVLLTWDAYPTAAQTNAAGTSVTPTAMRVYRASDAEFTTDLVKCDCTKYPLPEIPGNFATYNHSGSGTTYYYGIRQYYYLVGAGSMETESVESGDPPDLHCDWWEDAIVDQCGLPGVFDQIFYGRSDSGYQKVLEYGLFGWRNDFGTYPEENEDNYSVTPGVDIPLSATNAVGQAVTPNLYDRWPGQADAANNPWVSV
jgi:hypothetical protein